MRDRYQKKKREWNSEKSEKGNSVLFQKVKGLRRLQRQSIGYDTGFQGNSPRLDRYCRYIIQLAGIQE